MGVRREEENLQSRRELNDLAIEFHRRNRGGRSLFVLVLLETKGLNLNSKHPWYQVREEERKKKRRQTTDVDFIENEFFFRSANSCYVELFASPFVFRLFNLNLRIIDLISAFELSFLRRKYCLKLCYSRKKCKDIFFLFLLGKISFQRYIE